MNKGIRYASLCLLSWGDENSHIGALNFHLIFISLFGRKVSGVSVQNMLLRLPSDT